jgi:hypothetical protein
VRRLLLYSQVGSMGGSTRLLLNLGSYLADEAEVFLALPEVNDSNDEELRFGFISYSIFLARSG